MRALVCTTTLAALLLLSPNGGGRRKLPPGRRVRLRKFVAGSIVQARTRKSAFASPAKNGRKSSSCWMIDNSSS